MGLCPIHLQGSCTLPFVLQQPHSALRNWCPSQRWAPAVESSGCEQCGFSESSEYLSEQSVFYAESWHHHRTCWKVLARSFSLSPSLSPFLALSSPNPAPSLSSTSPPVSSSFHQDEDCWVRKILSGLTKHDFKLRSRPSIFSVSLLS